MKRKTITSPYLIIGLVLFCWVSVPRTWSDELRLFTVASLSPAWKWGKCLKQYLADRPEGFWGGRKSSDSSELQRLQIENQALRARLAKAMQWLESEQRILEQKSLLESPEQKNFPKEKAAHLRDLLRWELMAMPAQVIYRDPSSWSSSLWINVGETENSIFGRSIIAKNSPVVAGTALVGVIDYVGKRHSRVRLITDSGLSPSVRAVRGASQNWEIGALAATLIDRLKQRNNTADLVAALKELGTNLGEAETYLAKGELRGSSAPLWRSRSPVLKGIGFHFDSTQPKDVSLREGDLLVTTGLDGVFPPDLLVGKVVKVNALKPGGYAFEIEAKPAAINFNQLQTLFVLSPLSD